MSIYALTGKPRQGKSQRAIKLIFDLIEENDKREKRGEERRIIYCDINGINAPSTKTQLPEVQYPPWRSMGLKPIFYPPDSPELDKLDMENEYYLVELGAILIVDECHKLDWVRETTGTLSKNPTTISLNEHGHAGIDIWLITQFPHYIHTHIRGLVEQQWHVKRKFGMKWAKIYKWDDFQTTPTSDKALNDAFEVEKFYFKAKYQDCYKSASANEPPKFTFPKKLFIPLILIPLLLLISYSFFSGSILDISSHEQSTQEQQQQQSEQQSQPTPEQQQQLQQLEDLQLQAQIAEQERLIKQQQRQLDNLKDEYLPKHIAVLAEYEEVRPAGVIRSDKGCMVYNSYGETLNITDSLCNQMIDYNGQVPRSRGRNVSEDVNLDKNMNVQYFDSSNTPH